MKCHDTIEYPPRSGYNPYYSQPAADSSSSSVVSANRTSSEYAAAGISEVGTMHEEAMTAAAAAKTSSENQNAMAKTAVKEEEVEEEFSLTPKVDYNKVAEGLSVFKRTNSKGTLNK